MGTRPSAQCRSGWFGAGMFVLPIVAGTLGAGTANAADVAVNFYGDINYAVEKQDQTSNSFSVPRFELFVTGTQDRLAFLAETMFEVGENNEFGVDVERVEVSYLIADWLRIRAGRIHTAIGYYNDAYHHGRFFQMTVDRPAMVRFEDEGGLIAAHSVGVHADGRFHIGVASTLRYDIDVANGRGHTAAEVTNLVDSDKGKLLNLRLRIEPGFLDGLIVGGNILVDSSNAATTPDPAGPTTFMREVMVGGHVAYLEHNVQVIGEYLHVIHRADGATHATDGAFLEFGYAINRVMPYVRGEWVKFPAITDIDPFFLMNASFASRGTFTSGLLGIRLAASDNVALKVEGEYVNRDVGTDSMIGSLQCAFAF